MNTPTENPTKPRHRLRAVTLRVQDLDQVASFYGDVIGLRRTDEAEGRAGFGPPDEQPIVWLEHAPDAAPRRRETAGLFHLALRVPDEEALSQVLRRLEAQKYPLEGASDHLVSKALYTSDPEGNGVEIYCDRPREAWTFDEDGEVVMDTLPLDLDALHSTGEVAKPIREMDLGHVHLEVTDLDASRRFYEEVLGMSSKATWRGARFVAWDDYHHHVGLNTWRRRTRPLSSDEIGVAGVTCELEAQSDVEMLVERATRREVEMTRGDDRIVMRDPDGIRWTVTFE